MQTDEPCPYGTPGCECHRPCDGCSYDLAHDLYMIEVAAGRGGLPPVNLHDTNDDYLVDDMATNVPWWQSHIPQEDYMDEDEGFSSGMKIVMIVAAAWIVLMVTGTFLIALLVG